MKTPARELPALLALAGLTLAIYWKIAFTGQVLPDYDLFVYFYPYREFASESLRSGHVPLWNPYIYAGVPFLGNIQATVFYPFNLLFLSLRTPDAVNASILVHVFLAGAGMYAFARFSMALARLPAFIAAMAFAFGGFFSAQVGHINQISVAAWTPLLLLLFDLAFRRGSLLALAGGSIVLALQFYAGHPQEAFLALVALAVFAVMRLLQGSRPVFRAGNYVLPLRSLGRRWAWGMGACMAIVLLGAGLAAVQLLPTWELSGESIRGGGLSYAEATSFSLKPTEILRALLPGYTTYPLSEYIAYVGFFPLALALAGVLFRPRHPFSILAIVLGTLSVLLAVGKFSPVYRQFFFHVPGFDLFRVPARWLYLYSFAASMAAGVGASWILEPRARSRRFLPAAAFAAVFLIVLAVTLRVHHRIEMPERYVAWAWIGLGALAAGLVALRPLAPGRPLLILMALFASLDLFFAGRFLPFNQPVPDAAYDWPRPAVTQLQSEPAGYRVLSIASTHFHPGDYDSRKESIGKGMKQSRFLGLLEAFKLIDVLSPNTPMRFDIATLDGYDGGVLPLKRFTEFRDLVLSATPGTSHAEPDVPLRFQLKEVPDTRTLSALGVRYIVADKIGDAWVDGVYYDLSARALAGPGESLVFDDLPSQQATFFGLVTHVNDATLEDGVVVGLLTLTSTDGRVVTGDLVAGKDTAQGLNGPQSGNPGPKPVAATRENPPSQNYLLRVNLPERMSVSGIEVRYLLDKGTLEVRGGALLDETTGAQTALLPVAGLHTIYSGDVKIYENTECLPRAFLVHDFVVADDQTLLPALRAADLRTQAVLTEPPMGLTPTGVSQDQAAADSTELVEDHPERVTVRVNAASPGLLVLADSFYPGWKARVDGQSARILRANHMFRAVAVPAGQHAVTFTYQPSSYSRGRAVTFASLGVLVVLLAGPPFVRSRFVRARLPWRQKVSA